MSQTGALRTPGTSPGRAPGRVPAPAPHLRMVQPPDRHRSPTGLIVLCVVLLTGGLLGVLVLNLSLERGSYTIAAQQRSLAALSETNQDLAADLATRAAPSRLASLATSLGMVDNTRVTYVGGSGPASGTDPAPTTTDDR